MLKKTSLLIIALISICASESFAAFSNVEKKIMLSVRKQAYPYFYKTLLSNKEMNIDFEIVGGSTVLMMASNKKNEKIVAKLIKFGADVNKQDNKGRTALMRAVKKGNLKVIEVLLKNEASVSLKNKEGKTARDYNLSENKAEVSKLLDQYDQVAKEKASAEKAEEKPNQEKTEGNQAVVAEKQDELESSDGRIPYPFQIQLSYQYLQTPFDTSSDSIYESGAGINNYGISLGYHFNRALYLGYEYHASEFEATTDNEDDLVVTTNKEDDYVIDYAKSLFITNQLYLRISPFVGVTFLEGFYLQLGAVYRDWSMEMRGNRVIGDSGTVSGWEAEINWPNAAYTAGLGYTYVFSFGMSFNLGAVYYGGAKPEYTFEVADSSISDEDLALEKEKFEENIIDPAASWLAGQFSIGWNF